MIYKTAMAIARMIVGKSLFSPPSQSVYRWAAANDTHKPPSGKDRSKVKAARKQRNKKWPTRPKKKSTRWWRG